MSFNAAPLEQRIFGIDAPVDNRVIEIIRNAEYKVGRYFRNVLPELTNVNYVIKRLPTYCETGIERTKDGYQRYIKPVQKIMGAYSSRIANGLKTIFIDPIVNSDDILRTGGYLPDGTHVYPIENVGNLEKEVPIHELIHSNKEDLGLYPRALEEGITQLATEQILQDAGGVYPLETEAARRTMKEHGAGEVFYPTMISPSGRRRIVNTFQRHYNNLKRRLH